MENNKKEITEVILIAFIAGEVDAEMRERVEAWIAFSPENNKQYNTLLKAWEVTKQVKPKPVTVNTDKAWDNVLEEINKKETKVIPIKKANYKKTILTVAALFVVMIGVYWMLQNAGIADDVITKVAQNNVIEDQLSDGSVITLNQNTSLVYPKEFTGDERRVSLTGEAFFDIERDVEKPFIIDLPENAYVKVLGTSFNIKATEGDSITVVFVSTGKVEFGSGDNKIILEPGERGVLNNKTGEIYKSEEKSSGINTLYWKEEMLEFTNVPLSEVVTVLNALFEEQVICECATAKELSTRSKHPKSESLSEILKVITEMHGLKITHEERDNKKVFILDCNEN